MLIIVSDNEAPRKVKKREAGYNNGYRMGMFDRCNNRSKRKVDKLPAGKYNDGYAMGYLDGWESNG